MEFKQVITAYETVHQEIVAPGRAGTAAIIVR
jgi:hypothetical protein